MMKKTLSVLRKIASWLLTAVLVAVLFSLLYQKLSGNVPGVFGYHMMYVLTGSMSPEIEAGDAIAVKDIDGENVRLGDVICYYSTSGEMAGKLITHKVIEEPYEKDGERYLRTQGVANPAPDDPIRTDQVFGKVVMRLRIIGKIYKFFCTVPGLIVILLPVVLMFVQEIRRMTVCIKEEIDESAEASEDDAEKTADKKEDK